MNLTLKWPRYFPPVGAQGGGGFLGTPLKKTSFRYEFYVESLVNDKACNKDQNTEKNLKIGWTVSKWRPKNRFLCRVKNFPAKISKTVFPKEFSHENLLKVAHCKYNYIAKIKLEKSYSVSILWAKQIWTAPSKNHFMLISTKTTGSIWIFLPLRDPLRLVWQLHGAAM